MLVSRINFARLSTFLLFLRIAGCAVAGPLTLHTVQQVRELTPAEAARGIPVRVRGVVTTSSGWKNSFFLQDSTAGISVNLKDQASRWHSGDLVDLEGVTEPGRFAPGLLASRVNRIGTAPLPSVHVYPLGELQGGAQDSQWIAVRGVVRSAESLFMWEHKFLSLLVDTGEGEITAYVVDYEGDPHRFIDSLVAMEGACGTAFNDRRQFVGLRLFVPSLAHVKVLLPGNLDPFEAPPRPIDSVFSFGHESVPAHMVVVRGTVTYQLPGQELYMQSGDRGLLVYTNRHAVIAIGSEVEAAGFAATGRYSPVLEDAVTKVIGHQSVRPLKIEPEKIIVHKNTFASAPSDALLVQLRGRLVEWTESGQEIVLLLRTHDSMFGAKLEKTSAGAPVTLENGSLLDLTGICVAHTGRGGEPDSFELLLRSAADIHVVSHPSWWNVNHVLGMLAVTGLLASILLVLMQSLRMRVARQKSALAQSANSFKQTLENLPLFALILDEQGRITSCNRQLLEVLGVTLDSVLGLDWKERFVEDVWQTATDSSHKQETQIRTRGGELRLVSWINTVVMDAAGAQTGTAYIGEDVSERRHAEAALKRAALAAAEANRAKSAFLANMSHEIRTPMNGILGMTDLVLESPLSEDQRENLKIVKSSADSLLVIINDILDFSKIEAGKMTLEPIPFHLEDAVAECMKPFAVRANSKGLELVCDIGSHVPHDLIGDCGRLRQIINNLVGNAIKFTSTGYVVLRVGLEARSGSEVGLHFQVEDSGVGIRPEQQEAIFEAFAQADASITRQFGGTGLGLSISSRLVEAFRGRIWVESEPGVGSTFHFTARFGIGAATKAALKGVELGGLRVLVAEDNDMCREIWVRFLSGYGMQVTVATNGLAAVDEARAAVEEGRPFPLIMLDRKMPILDGFEIAAKVRGWQESANTKMMMICAGGERGDAILCKNLGIGGYLLKPLTSSELLRGILTVLGSTAVGDQPVPLVTRHSLREARRHILVAEDNKVNQRLALRLLEKNGHTVVIANNGSEAVEALQREKFDLVLMDIQMPVMNGFEATAAIRNEEEKTGVHVPIIALTAHAMVGDRERCLSAGMDGYLTKPIQAEQLYALLA
jgi:PAS domain S-box-containing protein